MGLRACILPLEIGKLIICEIGYHFVLLPNFECAKNEIIDNWKKNKERKSKKYLKM